MTEHEQKWISVKAMVQDRFGKAPDMEAVLFLIGMNEVGFDVDKQFKKEEKQDLMHVATCHLLSIDGFYEYIGHDKEGWPHYEKKMDFPNVSLTDQEQYLQEKIIQYLAIE
jgi:hypothetical protein